MNMHKHNKYFPAIYYNNVYIKISAADTVILENNIYSVCIVIGNLIGLSKYTGSLL